LKWIFANNKDYLIKYADKTAAEVMNIKSDLPLKYLVLNHSILINKIRCNCTNLPFIDQIVSFVKILAHENEKSPKSYIKIR